MTFVYQFLFWALFTQSSIAGGGPFFSYAIKAGPTGYLLAIDMAFSHDVSLNRAVANFRDDGLLHELYANADPVETTGIYSTGEGVTYHKLLSIRNYGIRTRMLSSCVESRLTLGTSWHRHCELELAAFDGGKIMGSKIDDITCSQASPLDEVTCHLLVKGLIKDYLFLSSAVLTVKAKAQALLNWGRFWYFTDSGSISARFSNDLFDRSDLAKKIENFTTAALALAKISPFDLAAQWRIEGQVVPVGR